METLLGQFDANVFRCTADEMRESRRSSRETESPPEEALDVNVKAADMEIVKDMRENINVLGSNLSPADNQPVDSSHEDVGAPSDQDSDFCWEEV